MAVLLYIICGFLALGTLLNIGAVGKPRAPLTAGIVIGIVVIQAFIITTLCFAAAALS